MYYDIHCHLTDNIFLKQGVESLIKECEKNKVVAITNGLDYDDNKEVLQLAEVHDYVFSALGFYPSYNFDNRVISQIEDNADKVVAIGEIGMDYTYIKDKEIQKKEFIKMISLANKLSKPIIVHSRKAELDVLSIVAKKAKVPVVLHAFLTKKSNVKRALDIKNVYFSISAIVDYSEQVKDVVRMVPIDRIFCETDSPYMWKGGINRPINVIKAYEAIAKIKNLSVKEVEILIEENIEKVFGIVV